MAVYPVAAGHPDLSGTYIPTLYAAKLLVEFYAASVFGAIANTNYEGQISRHGDTVKIRTLPDITVRNYVKGQDLNYEKPEPSTVDLLIDKGKYWALSINLVDTRQSDIDFVSQWATHASEQVKSGPNGIDVDVLANIYGSAHASNAGATAGAKSSSINLGVSGTPLSLTKVNVLDILVDCMTVLDEQNAPESGRWVVLPAWACGLIKKSDLKDASLAGDGTSILRNGRIGMIDRAEVFMSNNLTTSSSGGQTATECVFGHKIATTFASQITEKEIIPNPNDFGQLLRALQVYGYKVAKPEALGHLHVYKG